MRVRPLDCLRAIVVSDSTHARQHTHRSTAAQPVDPKIGVTWRPRYGVTVHWHQAARRGGLSRLRHQPEWLPTQTIPTSGTDADTANG